MKDLIRKNVIFETKDINEKEFTIKGVFSTSAEDRHGEIIDQTGWNLKEYMTNPVILFGHDQYTPAIGQMLELGLDGNGNLAGVMKFAVEEFELAKTIFNLYKGKFMRAFSVGFRNEKYEYNEDEDMLVLKENTLYELSCVNVPANAMALASSKGIDTTSIKEALKKNRNEEIEITGKSIEEFVKEKVQESIRSNTAIKKEKVETPKGKGGEKKTYYKNKKINKVIRQLLEEKDN